MTLAYYIPDTTGINPTYKVSNDIFTYFENGMVIEFETPVFYDSISIISGYDGSKLIAENHYTIKDRDYTSESRARNLDANFSKRLVSSITITAYIVLPYQLTVSYQCFYPRTPTNPIDSASGNINLTPGLMRDILARLTSVEQKSLTVGSSSIPTDAIVNPLTLDINGVNANNVITETHSVNTFSNINTIFPQQGAFFKDSVVLKANDVTLLEGVDYYIADFDRYRTTITNNRSGIYHAIVVLKDYAGELSLTYHAVGGKPTIDDVIGLQAGMKDIITYLTGTQYLTSSTLNSDPYISNITARIANLEEEMRALMQAPSYGKTTTGTTVARTFKAPDTGLHWWTIGSLYQVDNSSEVFTADTMKIAIEMPDRHLRADLYLSVDILNTTQPLKISAQNVMYDQGYSFFGTTGARVQPPILFRIIYNETADNASGVYLQIGTSIPSLVERFAITDNSGVESAWMLALQNSSDAATPNDVAPITLPNSTRLWNSSGGQSVSAVVTMPLDEGYLLFAGSLDQTDISVPAVTKESPYSVAPITPGWMPVTQATSVDVYYTGTAGDGKLVIPMVYDLNLAKSIGSTAVTDFSFSDASYGSLKCTLTKDLLTLFYTGTVQPAGSFVINYVNLHTGNSSDIIKG